MDSYGPSAELKLISCFRLGWATKRNPGGWMSQEFLTFAFRWEAETSVSPTIKKHPPNHRYMGQAGLWHRKVFFFATFLKRINLFVLVPHKPITYTYNILEIWLYRITTLSRDKSFPNPHSPPPPLRGHPVFKSCP